jgi:hypothetical protein
MFDMKLNSGNACESMAFINITTKPNPGKSKTFDAVSSHGLLVYASDACDYKALYDLYNPVRPYRALCAS